MPRPTSDVRADWQERWIARHGGPDFWAEGPPPWQAPRWVSLWLPVIVSFVVQVPAAVFLARTGDAAPLAKALGVLIALIGPVALIGARRFPGPVIAVVAAAASADLFVHDVSVAERGDPPYVALAFAIVGGLVRGARTWVFVAVAVCWAADLTLAAVLRLEWQGWRIAATTLGILIVLGIGEMMRTRRERFRAMRARFAARRQNEVQAERVRIARELHDVLAHSLSQINVQAGVGLHLMDKQPDKAAEALSSIKATSKTALDEVRSVLGILRAEDGADPTAPLVPEPDLGRLPGLAASVSSQGLPVDLDDRVSTDGAPVPKPVQLAIFRIVQESLTNAVRHAHASRATVTLEIVGGSYRVQIQDDGVGTPPGSGRTGSGGRGLLGMRERAELLGGTLQAGPSGGGFRVTATIPWRRTESSGASSAPAAAPTTGSTP